MCQHECVGFMESQWTLNVELYLLCECITRQVASLAFYELYMTVEPSMTVWYSTPLPSPAEPNWMMQQAGPLTLYSRKPEWYMSDLFLFETSQLSYTSCCEHSEKWIQPLCIMMITSPYLFNRHSTSPANMHVSNNEPIWNSNVFKILM